jgi:two-component system, NarL family, sensor histidine kinase EvgS
MSSSCSTTLRRAVPAVVFRYAMDDTGQVHEAYLSPGAEAFFGVPLQTRVRLLEQLAERLAPADLARALESQQRAMLKLEAWRASVQYAHPDGRVLQLRCDAQHSRAAGPGLHVWTGVVTDVTSEHALQQQLAREAEQRYVLLASASHELRAPTHILSLALQSVPEPVLAGDGGRALNIAREAAQTLSLLLDDVLDAARVSAGRVELRPQNFDLRALLGSVAEGHATGAAAKGLRFSFSLADEVPHRMLADPLRLRQVLTNLLSNAVKYTERGGIELRAETDALSGLPALRLRVRDSGPGIPEVLRQRLFQPFAAAAPQPGRQSTGLGLSVCHRLVSMMGGRLDIGSLPGKGTEATVLLPLPEGAAAARRRGALLVCDDDAVSRMLLAGLLQGQGHRVLEATGAAQALELWRGGGVAALITDLNMPQGSGAELMATLRAEEAAAGAGRMPVVVCSGDPPAPLDGAPPAWDAFIQKPADLQTLVGTLAGLGVLPEIESAA